MKLVKNLALCLILLTSILGFSACQKETPLNLSVYCYPTATYTLNGSETATGINVSDLVADTCPQNSYSKIQITTSRSWTYGLTLKKVSFDVILSEPANMDIDLTISNLENGQNYNSTKDTYFYHKTLNIGKEHTSVTLDINDTFINKDAVFSFEVVTSCYTDHPNLKFSIANLKMFGEHQQTQY